MESARSFAQWIATLPLLASEPRWRVCRPIFTKPIPGFRNCVDWPV